MTEPAAKDPNTSQGGCFGGILILVLYLSIGSGFASGLYSYKNESPGDTYTLIDGTIVTAFWPFVLASKISQKIGYGLR
jgi:hypothetical protein